MRRTAILIAVTALARLASGQCPPADATNWCSGTYQYDGSGNIKAIGADTYRYDELGRLVSGTADVQRSGGTSEQDYTYDAFGNRNTVRRTAGSVGCFGPCEIDAKADPYTNHLNTNSAAYDDAGNLSAIDNATYWYDAAGSLNRAKVGADDREFVYTADDERIAIRQGVSWTWTVRGLDQKVLREFTSLEVNGVPTSNRQWAKDYVWREGMLLSSAAPTSPGASTTAVQHFHLDHLGTPRVVSNGAGVVMGVHAYYPFGAELNLSPHENPTEPMKFTGHERDVIAGDGHSLDAMHARYQMGTLGRFLSVDPEIDVKRALSGPQRWNRYIYVVNSPISGVDTNGRADRRTSTDRAILEDPDVLVAVSIIVDRTGYQKPLTQRVEHGAIIVDLGHGDYGTDGVVTSASPTHVDFRIAATGHTTTSGKPIAATIHSHPGTGMINQTQKVIGGQSSQGDQNLAQVTGSPVYILNEFRSLIKYDPSAGRDIAILTGRHYRQYLQRAQLAQQAQDIVQMLVNIRFP